MTSLQVLGSSATDTAGNIVLGSQTPIALSATDPISNGVASGVSQTYYVVDADPASSSCLAVPLNLNAPPGTCANKAYNAPFTLSPGLHRVFYFSKDNVGNQELENSTTIYSVSPVTPYTIDASSLAAQWGLRGVFGPAAPGVQQFAGLGAGTYELEFLCTPEANVKFSITPLGVFDYDPSLNALLSGRGTRTLKINPILKLTVNAASLGTGSWSIDCLSNPASPGTQQFSGLLPGPYFLRVPASGAGFSFNLSTADSLSYDPSLGSLLSGVGTSTLTINAVMTLTVDASQLTAGTWRIDGVNTDTAPGVQSFSGLLPGSYFFHIPASNAGFTFQFLITNNGTLDYDHSLDAVVSGRGTKTLTINPVMTLTVDATAVGTQNWRIDGINTDTPPSVQTFGGLLPGTYNFHLSGTGAGVAFQFLVANNGTLDYDHGLDFIISGRGTKLLKINPVLSLTVDATAMTSAWRIDGMVNQVEAPSVQNFPGLLPGYYVFRVLGTSIFFNIQLNADGSASAPNNLGVSVTGHLAAPPPPGFSGAQVSTDGIHWQASTAVLGSASGAWARILVQDSTSGINPANGGYGATLTTDGGNSFAQVPQANVTLVATGGPSDPFILTASSLTLTQSLSLNAIQFTAQTIGGAVGRSSFTVQTLAVVQSPVIVAGNPELIFAAPINPTAQSLPQTSTTGVAALQASATQQIAVVSGMYLLGPDTGTFSTQALITFYYDPVALAAQGIAPTDLGIYDYNALTKTWVFIGGTLDPNAHSVTVSVTRISSVLALIGDKKPPVTTLALGSPAFGLFITSATPLSLAPSKTARSYYAVDSATFAALSGAFVIAGPGTHIVRYYSVDQTGNVEAVRTSTMFVDALSPRTSLAAGAPNFMANALYAAQSTTFSLIAQDDLALAGDGLGAGVVQSFLAIDGGGYSLALGTFSLAAEGLHGLRFYSVDAVGHAELPISTAVALDLTAPVSNLSVVGLSAPAPQGGLYLSTSSLVVLASTDPVSGGVASGLASFFYYIDVNASDPACLAAPFVATAPVGSCANPDYAGPFVLSPGTHTVSYFGIDNVGNEEELNVASVTVTAVPSLAVVPLSGSTVTTNSPMIYALYTASGGVNLASLRLSLDGIDVTTRAVVTASSASLAAAGLSQGPHVIAASLSDFVGDAVLASSTFNVHSIPPLTTLVIYQPQFSSGTIYIATATLLGFTANLPGQTFYALDSTAAFALFTTSFTIPAQGPHSIAYYSVSNLGVAEVARSSSVVVDATPPLTTLSLGTPDHKAFGLDVITPATPISLTAADALSGVAQTTFRIDAGPLLAYTTSFNLPLGTHAIDYGSADRVGNAEVRKTFTLAVADFQLGGLQSSAGAALSGKAQVMGSVESDQTVSLSGNSKVSGSVAAGIVARIGHATITGSVTQGVSPLVAQPISLSLVSQLAQASNQNGLIPPWALSGGGITLGAGAALTLTTGSYVVSGISIVGGASLSVNGPVDILLQGPLSLTGTSVLNAAGAPGSLLIFSNSSAQETLDGGALASAWLYAPLSALSLAGNSQLAGHAFVKEASLAGEALLVAADGAVAGSLRTTAEAQAIRAPESADTFYMRGVHVLPTPVRGGRPATIRVLTGLADRVNVAVYSIMGQLVKSGPASPAHLVADGGLGPQWAFDFNWDTSGVASGVYWIAVTAQKAGQADLKASAKAMVIR